MGDYRKNGGEIESYLLRARRTDEMVRTLRGELGKWVCYLDHADSEIFSISEAIYGTIWPSTTIPVHCGFCR
jgi:hypothetical protein